MVLEVDGLLRAGSTRTIEGGLAAIPDTTMARVNVDGRRVAVEWRDGKVDPVRFINRLSELGYRARPCNADSAAARDRAVSPLLRCLGVAALAVLVVGLLPFVSPSVAAADIRPEGRDVFEWLSAAIAFPAAAWAGRPFFVSAFRSVAAGNPNRDAPISAAVALAFSVPLLETADHIVQASCETGLLLVGLALAGRALEQAVRDRTPTFAENLVFPADETVTKFVSDTELAEVPVASIRSGDLVLVRPGERIALDGVVSQGRSEIDESLVTGETLPVSVAKDSVVYAGTLNVSGALRVKVGTAECIAPPGHAMRERPAGTTGQIRLSDRAARSYPPLALAAAFVALTGRVVLGAEWNEGVTAAAAVLVATSPTALGLAVSAVEAWAAGALARAGVLLKSGDSIERLARVDTILFDKTGTLTVPEPEVVNTADIPPERLAVAGRLALASRHPLAAAVARAAGVTTPIATVEEPGQGACCIFHGVPLRLGRPSFCDAERGAAAVLETDPEASVIAFAYGTERYVLAVRQHLRSDAIETVARLKQQGLTIEIMSGDRAPAVAHAARTLGVERWHAGMTPADKIGHICVLQAQGRTVLMVGDGINDASSLAAADVALSVRIAAPPALAAADAVFAGDRLSPVVTAIAIARRARQLRRRNLLFAAACIAIAAPAAITGLMGPLVAALAMSAAALLVSLNALCGRAR